LRPQLSARVFLPGIFGPGITGAFLESLERFSGRLAERGQQSMPAWLQALLLNVKTQKAGIITPGARN
jgi:hypothetical protein